MKWSKYALAAALFGALGMTPAWGQDPGGFYYTAQDANPASPSDAAASMDMSMMMAEEAPAEEEAEEEDEGPLRLFPQGEHCWNLYGWLNVGYAANNFSRPPVNFNGPITFYDRNREFSGNQAYAVLEKKIAPEECCWDFGGRVDYLYGWDARFTTEVGWELDTAGGTRWNGANAYYGSAIPQAYGEAGIGDWSFKAGRFYTLIGYEGVMAPVNFFPTHAYTMQYGEPFTHTGALATKKINDQLTATGGVVNGWDAFDRSQDQASAIGGFTWVNCEGNFTLATYGIVGNERLGAGTADDRYANRWMYSIVGTYVINDCWTYVIQHDNGYQDVAQVAAGAAPAQGAEWYGLNQYLFRTINDCWKLGARGEIFRDDDGFRVAAVHPQNPMGGGYAGNFYEVALGANWTPNKNLVVRPEVRFDWYDGPVGANGTQPFGVNSSSQTTFVIDAILHY